MPCRLRRITIYETTGRFYVVGCDAVDSRYNVLKIDRVEPKKLLLGEPESDYTRQEILELLATISEGSSVVYRGSQSKKGTKGGLIERVNNGFGLLGVVQFLEAYYLLVITKANPVATIGYHTIFKVAEVAMICTAMDGVSTSAEEQRYVKLFQSVDLSTDFYFSYSYDLSRSLQENALKTDWSNGGERTMKFVWNQFLLEPLRKNLISERWFVEVVHGYLRQEHIHLPVSRLSLTIIGRRSTKYAGTRFLKRGANPEGHVANFVETEQILWDTATSPCIVKGKFSSFVQIRGSVPLRWSQDPSTRGVVGKPLILIDINEPLAHTAAAHFRDLRNKYSNPIVIMNLVKRKEKRRHEGVLHDQFLRAVDYLNQFVPDEESLCYLSFDVARCNKAANMIPSANVLNVMEDLASKAILKQGWFQSFDMPESLRMLPREALKDLVINKSPDGRFLIQQGVCRTNCVDCLDRTNVAQFSIAKVALGFQLTSMGLLDEPSLSLQSEVCRLLEDVFDEHGDTMAFQYAGSALVHSIKTYKKTAAFQERRRDVIQTLSRYYSNTFADYDKQAAINLFLGVFRPNISSKKQLWELTNDYFLHWPHVYKPHPNSRAWMYTEDELRRMKFVESDGDDWRQCIKIEDEVNEEEENYRDFYRIHELTCLDGRVKKHLEIENRAIHVEGCNQEVSTQAQFLKLWKTTESKENSAKKEESDDEEEDEDNTAQYTDVLEVEKSWAALVSRPGNFLPDVEVEKHRRNSIKKPKNDRTILGTGLLFARDIYKLENLRTTPEERRYFEKYVSTGGFKYNKEDWELFRKKPTLLSELKLPLTQLENRRPTFFTTDDVFRTEMPEVRKQTYEFYEKSTDVLGHECPLPDLSNFSKYPTC